METVSLVSVIIPVFNGERYLAEAIESVLSQTYRPIEVIVVDDGSTDGCAEIVRGFKPMVQYSFQVHSGIAAAINHGIDLARGTIFGFVDADDIWVEDKLALQMGVLSAQPELDIVFGHVKHFISPELDETLKRKLYCPADAMPGYAKGTMLIRRDAMQRVGPFDNQWQVGDFIDWYSKAKEKDLKSLVLSGVVMKRRLHDNNIGVRKRDSQTDFVRILKAALDRRRAAIHCGGK
jgi:glycosyltransferase involved in cell wall biosynthesis